MSNTQLRVVIGWEGWLRNTLIYICMLYSYTSIARENSIRMSIMEHFSALDRDLAVTYAVQLKPLIMKLKRELCFGCSVSHPSQNHHDICLMMTFEEQIHHCLNEAVNRIDEEKITMLLHRFTASKKVRDLPSYIFDVSWRVELWGDEEWRDLVVGKILSLNNF